jgi:hypothetical protein
MIEPRELAPLITQWLQWLQCTDRTRPHTGQPVRLYNQAAGIGSEPPSSVLHMQVAPFAQEVQAEEARAAALEEARHAAEQPLTGHVAADLASAWKVSSSCSSSSRLCVWAAVEWATVAPQSACAGRAVVPPKARIPAQRLAKPCVLLRPAGARGLVHAWRGVQHTGAAAGAPRCAAAPVYWPAAVCCLCAPARPLQAAAAGSAGVALQRAGARPEGQQVGPLQAACWRPLGWQAVRCHGVCS